MEEIIINETPVRTSKNFGINNIEINEKCIIKSIPKFKNVKINGKEVKIEYNPKCNNLIYGLGNILEEQVLNSANQKLQIVLNSCANKENEIKFRLDKENSVLVDNIELIAEEGIKSTVIIKYETDGDIQGYHNGIIRLNARKESQIDIIVLNLMNIDSNNFISIENTLEENAKVNYTIIDFGGKHSITNYYSNLIGNASENNLNTIYLGKEQQLFDLNYIAELRGTKTNVNIEVQGALKDKAKKHFKGTIDFKKGCKKAKGNENEACMLLSDTAKSLALPMLLCSEEDVEGNHSSSAGKVGEKELFYIMSRGFELKEAMKLMVRAKFNKILESIENEELKSEILEEIDKRLD